MTINFVDPILTALTVLRYISEYVLKTEVVIVMKVMKRKIIYGDLYNGNNRLAGICFNEKHSKKTFLYIQCNSREQYVRHAPKIGSTH